MSLPTHFVFDPNDGMAFFSSTQDAESDAVARIACAMLDANGESCEILWGEIRGVSRLVPNESGGLSMRFVDPLTYPRQYATLDENGEPLSNDERDAIRRKRGEL